VLVGPESGDDAGVYRLDGHGLVATADFIPPVCDDPRRFGRIAATNSLSDVWAMGGEPLFALNLCTFPGDLPEGVAGEILAGGLEALVAAGGVLLGGHTVKDAETKYGLAVVGTVDPERILTLAGARVGQQVVLTKPLGTGVLVNAFKFDRLDAAGFEPALVEMERPNREAARLAREHDATAATDVTGFGLAGHAWNLSGRRSGHPPLAADPRPRQAGGAGGRQVPAHRHPDQQQPARRHRQASTSSPSSTARACTGTSPRPTASTCLLEEASSTSSPPSRRWSNRDWYQGTADAVRRNLEPPQRQPAGDMLILSGDQLYLMDLAAFVDTTASSGADLTVAVKPVPRGRGAAFGIMRVDEDGRIVEFVEKPKDPEVLDRFTLERGAARLALGFEAPPGSLLASMGIYVFRREMLLSCSRAPRHRLRPRGHPAAIEGFEMGDGPSSTTATGRTSAPSAPSTRPTST
jgi:hypothetical protein